ncbi:MAG: hypothetical protein U0Y68_10735 [Blastocatellia bacterium]
MCAICFVKASGDAREKRRWVRAGIIHAGEVNRRMNNREMQKAKVQMAMVTLMNTAASRVDYAGRFG